MHVGGDAGIHSRTEDIYPQLAVALHQVKGHLRASAQLLQLGKLLLVLRAEDFQKVVAGAQGHIGHRHMVKARCPVDDLI